MHSTEGRAPRQFKDLFLKGRKLKWFIDLRTEYNVPNTDFLKYLQIRGFVYLLIEEKKPRFDLSDVEETVLSCIPVERKIWEFYILYSRSASSFDPLLKVWEKELGMDLYDNTWLHICTNVQFPFASN